jgi:hypothetical protein
MRLRRIDGRLILEPETDTEEKAANDLADSLSRIEVSRSSAGQANQSQPVDPSHDTASSK